MGQVAGLMLGQPTETGRQGATTVCGQITSRDGGHVSVGQKGRVTWPQACTADGVGQMTCTDWTTGGVGQMTCTDGTAVGVGQMIPTDGATVVVGCKIVGVG
jgi:hypothetical protein